MMAHAFERHNFAKSETLWLAIQQDQKIEVRSRDIRAHFEFLADRSIVVRIRSADNSGSGAFASVSCDFGALLELFERFCDSLDFQPFSKQAVSQVGNADDLESLRQLKSFDKFNDEINALTQTERCLRRMIRAFSGLMSRYERSKYNRGNATAR